jgi:hypothetical protein
MDDDDDDDNIDSSDSEDRAMADVELLMAAYPEQVFQTTDGGDDSNILRSSSSFTLQLSISASLILEIPRHCGYPTTGCPLLVRSYQCGPQDASRLEAIVASVRATALDCQQEGVEAGFRCVQQAVDMWNNFDDSRQARYEHEHEDEDERLSPAVSDDDDATDTTDHHPSSHDYAPNSLITHSPSPSKNSSSLIFTWISGEALVDRKSTFVAHLCRLTREADVQPALTQLLQSDNKLQKATHNMVRA